MRVPRFRRAQHCRNINLRRSSVFAALTAGLVVGSCAPVPKSLPPVAVPPPVVVPQTDVGTTGYELADFWLAKEAVQGGLIIGRAPTGTLEVSLDGKAVPITREGFFLIGFDRDAGVSAKLSAKRSGGSVLQNIIDVAPGNWRIENVNASPTGSAATSAEFQVRRGAELARINAARTGNAMSDGWRQEFIVPFAGRISGLFGAQRIYRGTPGSYHSGMDIAAPTGTEFVAPADGVVTLAATDEFTLEGHLLMIDHGMGLNSAFLHCSELLVRQGDYVKKGQVIGRVGATGRASGPHLHWGMKWNSARIDPKLLIQPK